MMQGCRSNKNTIDTRPIMCNAIHIMDTHQEYTRINVTVHKNNLEHYRKLIDKSQQNVSRLLDEALEREVERAKRLKALAALKKLGPVGSGITDATAYIRKMRDEDDA